MGLLLLLAALDGGTASPVRPVDRATPSAEILDDQEIVDNLELLENFDAAVDLDVLEAL